MHETELKFENSKRRGVVPIGIYLIDGAKRLGERIETECGRMGQCDTCACLITKGKELLSPLTKLESEHLSASRRSKGERLACQAKIEKAGEIIAMPTYKKEEPTPTLFEQFKKEFEALPLQEKVKQLLDLEGIALGDSFSTILNLPYTIGGKIRDAMAEVGMKMDEEVKKAQTPAEHQDEAAPAEDKTSAKKPAPRKRAAAKKPASGTKRAPRKAANREPDEKP